MKKKLCIALNQRSEKKCAISLLCCVIPAYVHADSVGQNQSHPRLNVTSLISLNWRLKMTWIHCRRAAFLLKEEVFIVYCMKLS